MMLDGRDVVMLDGLAGSSDAWKETIKDPGQTAAFTSDILSPIADVIASAYGVPPRRPEPQQRQSPWLLPVLVAVGLGVGYLLARS